MDQEDIIQRKKERNEELLPLNLEEPVKQGSMMYVY